MKALLTPYNTDSYVPQYAYLIAGDVDPNLSLKDFFSLFLDKGKACYLVTTTSQTTTLGLKSREVRVIEFQPTIHVPLGANVLGNMQPSSVTSADPMTQLSASLYACASAETTQHYIFKQTDPTVYPLSATTSGNRTIALMEYGIPFSNYYVGMSTESITFSFLDEDKKPILVFNGSSYYPGYWQTLSRPAKFIELSMSAGNTAPWVMARAVLVKTDAEQSPYVPEDFSLVFTRRSPTSISPYTETREFLHVVPCSYEQKEGRMFLPTPLAYGNSNTYLPPMALSWNPYTETSS